MNKELKSLAALARAQCWTVDFTDGNHIRWSPPSGADDIITAATPSSTRSIANIKADLKRAGLVMNRQAWRRYERELQTIMRDIGIKLPPSPLETAAIIEVATSGNEVDMFCHWHEPPKQFVNPVGAAMHRQKCKNRPDPDSQEIAVDRKMDVQPPLREQIRCPEGCPDWWTWISQPHLLDKHMLQEHGKKQCPYCQKWWFYKKGGWTNHTRSCDQNPENLSLRAAEIRAKLQDAGREVEPEPEPVSPPVPVTVGGLTFNGRDDAIAVDMPDGKTIVLDNPVRPEPEEVAVADTTPESIAAPPTIAPAASGREMPVITADVSDDDLWALMEMVLDQPVLMNRQTLAVVNAWMDATKALLALKDKR